MAEQNTKDTVNWEELTDEQVAQMSAPPGAATYEDVKEDTGEGEDPTLSQSDDEEDSDDVTDSDTGGADTGSDSDDDTDDSDDSSAADTGDSDTSDPYSGSSDTDPKDDQSKDKSDTKKDTEAKGSDSDETDWKAEYDKVMAPFKAAKREIQLENPEEARRLMQMGVDYNRKMQMMKPYQRVIHTLEKAKLIDPDRINFLIDLDKGNPAAIKKLLQTHSVDPTELGLEDSELDYTPTDHAVSDTELNVRDVFEQISDTESFDRTVTIMTKQWDDVSRNLLRQHPEWIPHINNHVADGTFDKVWPEVEKGRMLGKLTGLSDLDAYYQVGKAMADAGRLSDQQTQNNAPSSADTSTQVSAQGNGSPQDDPKRDLKRAASLTRGKKSSGGAKKVLDYGSLTDEQIEKMGIPSS